MCVCVCVWEMGGGELKIIEKRREGKIGIERGDSGENTINCCGKRGGGSGEKSIIQNKGLKKQKI